MKGSNKRGPRPAKTHTWCNRRLEGTEALELNRSRIREEGFPGPYISLHTKRTRFRKRKKTRTSLDGSIQGPGGWYLPMGTCARLARRVRKR